MMFKCVIYFTSLVAVFCQVTGNDDNTNEYLQNEIYQSGVTKNSTKTKRSESCLMENGELGECLAYYLCNGGKANTDGAGVIDLRMGSDDEPSCSSYLEVCCLTPDTRSQDNPIKPRIDERQGCGWRNPNGLGFTLTGNRDNEAEFGEFPWMVAVLRVVPMNKYQSATYYIGGGSLIHPSVVLTAAHILDMSALRVRAGEWDTQTEGEQYQYQERDVAEVDVHEEFNKEKVHYDVALLFVSQPFDLAPNVGLACIPMASEHLNFNDECFATGWGKDKFGKEGQYQNILKKVNLNLVDHGTCETQLRTTRLLKHFKLHSSFLCAGGKPEQDTCTGDGGSPLVCPVQSESDRYKQVGIVSWGVYCGEAGIPAVYADVMAIGGWIDRRLTLRGLDTSVYRY